MTYREKYAELFRNGSGEATFSPDDIHRYKCPHHIFELANTSDGCKASTLCIDCWDQEVTENPVKTSPEHKPVCPVDRSKLLITLEKCRNGRNCVTCQYRGLDDCIILLAEDALAYISYLEEVLGV